MAGLSKQARGRQAGTSLPSHAKHRPLSAGARPTLIANTRARRAGSRSRRDFSDCSGPSCRNPVAQITNRGAGSARERNEDEQLDRLASTALADGGYRRDVLSG